MIKQIISNYKLKKRMQTASDRTLPHAFIIGAQKAGTTSLFSYISQHPKVVAPFQKEIHYFDTNRYNEYPIEWYRSFFPTYNELDKGITLEATPCYMFYPNCVEKIHEVCPQAKLLMVLNNPIKRAISSYYHQVRRGREKRSIEDAFKNEAETINPEFEKIKDNPSYVSDVYRHFSYLKRGVYIDQIKACYKVFEKNQVMIIDSQALFKDPIPTLKNTFQFLGIDDEFIPKDLGRKNQGERSILNPFGYSKKDVPETVNKWLLQYFSEPNKRLSEYLCQEFNW